MHSIDGLGRVSRGRGQPSPGLWVVRVELSPRAASSWVQQQRDSQLLGGGAREVGKMA